MPRLLRTFGITVFALLALGSLSAAAAQAGQFTVGAYPAKVEGQHVGLHSLTTEIGVMECESKLEGSLTMVSEDLTLTPVYKCTIAGKAVHVSSNGCDYRFHAGATLGADEVEGSMDVKCPAGATIDFEVTSAPVCHLRIGEQLGLNDVTFINRTMAQDVDFDFDLEGIAYTLGANCSTQGAFANGTYEGTSTLKAFVAGFNVGFSVD